MIQFTNESSKLWLARKGAGAVFGFDVDVRDRFDDEEAIARFDQVWEKTLEPALAKGRIAKVDAFIERLSQKCQDRVDASAVHREFWVGNCLFIAQLPKPTISNELWFVRSFAGDPRLLQVYFRDQPSRTEFREVAKLLGWNDSALALALIRDFMEKLGPELKERAARAAAAADSGPADGDAASDSVVASANGAPGRAPAPRKRLTKERHVGKFTLDHPTDRAVTAEYGWDHAVAFFVTVYKKGRVFAVYDALQSGYADLRGALEVLAKHGFYEMGAIECAWHALGTALAEELPPELRLVGTVIENMRKAAD